MIHLGLYFLERFESPYFIIEILKDDLITAFTSNQPADWKRQYTGNIFQNYLLLNNLTVAENITIGISPYTSPIPLKTLTQLLQIDTLLDKFPSQLSGGEQQRVAIARAVIKKPALLFCDEATGALDEANSKQVVALLQELKRTFGLTILFVTHNLQIAETADPSLQKMKPPIKLPRQHCPSQKYPNKFHGLNGLCVLYVLLSLL